MLLGKTGLNMARFQRHMLASPRPPPPPNPPTPRTTSSASLPPFSFSKYMEGGSDFIVLVPLFFIILQVSSSVVYVVYSVFTSFMIGVVIVNEPFHTWCFHSVDVWRVQ